MQRIDPRLRPIGAESRERGAILILTALVMIVLLMIAAFATDLGAWYRQGQEQQRAADVASLNGVQAYDAAIKAYLEDKGIASYAALTAAQQAEAEELAMQDALSAISGTLAAGGVTLANAPALITGIRPATSNATATATNGTELAITRTDELAITVSVRREGTQYFSNIVRDAPQIAREGTAVISNCNAECPVNIPIEPPFSGFDASGDGDGWSPLLRGDEEVWAVNHHAYFPGWAGSVICMDRDTTDFCNFNSPGAAKTGTISLAGYQTANRMQEVIDNERDKIFFAARSASLAQAGVACIDMAARSFCSTPFVPIWPQSTTGGWPNGPIGQGPVQWNGNLYLIANNGQLACVNPDTNSICGMWMTAASTHPDIFGNNVTGRFNWIRLHEDRLYSTLSLTTGGIIHDCWDLVTASPCWGGFLPETSTTGTGGNRFSFFAFDSAGNETAICNAATNGRNLCADLDTGATFEHAGIRAHLPVIRWAWTGDAFAARADGTVRTFFGGGASNRTACWDWTANTDCGFVEHLRRGNGSAAVEPYAYAQVTPECVVGLGDEAAFFTININTLETCTGSSVSTTITPCICADGSSRYGVLELPPELLAVLDSANATVTDGTRTEVGDLKASPMDLSGFNGASSITLTIAVDSKVNLDGTLAWKETYDASLALTVQPTLVGDTDG